ncbi:MAG TPA: NADH-ubiquinone oxidoreductase-F iron-sulfur binding region domain-containing protein [Candidatus Limnocylindrales bacterium]|nr:NADH-ubiquinone oxidoreductase-F iron-sulfur binding region domain-containing protein [Candidatus Limnocylindrales bacterium]
MIDPLAPMGSAGIVLPSIGPAQAEDLAAHLAHYGPMPMSSPADVALIEASGLRGRGGAGFPTGVKWHAVAARAAGRGVVLVNGVEADPSSEKDRMLLTYRPHLVLDGAIMAARAVGASEVVVAVNRQAVDAHQAIRAAIPERRERLAIDLIDAPSRYVAGEETALVHFVNGGPARPTVTPPRPFDRGVRGRPTLVQNAETLAWAALIARHGDGWFRELGSSAAPGAMMVTVRGAVAQPGVYELSAAATVEDALAAAGDGGATTLLLGGYFGHWVDRARARPLQEVNAGVLIALPPSSCGLTETARIMSFLAGESARQCGPCFNGLPALSSAIAKVATGRAKPVEVERLRRWTGQLSGHRGACHHPDGAVALLRSALDTFAGDLSAHLQRGACRGSQSPSVLPAAKVQDGWR